MFRIVIDENDRRNIFSALIRLREKVPKEVEDITPMLMAADYMFLVARNIRSEKYSAGYADYEDSYAKWKKKKGVPFPGYWKLDNILVSELSMFRFKKGWMGGIPAGVTGKRGRPVALYGGAGEYPDVRPVQPARPVFTPSFEEYKNGDIRRRIDFLNTKVKSWWR